VCSCKACACIVCIQHLNIARTSTHHPRVWSVWTVSIHHRGCFYMSPNIIPLKFCSLWIYLRLWRHEYFVKDMHCLTIRWHNRRLERAPVPFCLHGEIERDSSTVDLTFGPSLNLTCSPQNHFCRLCQPTVCRHRLAAEPSYMLTRCAGWNI